MELLKSWIRKLLFIKPKISIIIPFYNSEGYILKCMESVVLHTKVPYEIICVNDGSTDESLAIVNRFRLTHPQVRLVDLKRNKGLYYARLMGILRARGKYVGFVDSDDYVSDGYFDLLYEAAVNSGSDISVAQIVNVNTDNVKYVQTRCATFPYTSEKAIDSNLYDLYWKQQGKCYHWHVVWNKIYKRKLFMDNIELLKKQTEHLVMLEDFIFSSIILKDVNKYSVNTQAKYFYVEHKSAATKNENYTVVSKNISDMKIAFSYVETFLKENLSYRKFIDDFAGWKSRYGWYWKRNIQNLKLQQKEKQLLMNSLKKIVGEDIEDVTATDEFYYEKSVIFDETHNGS